MYGLGGYTYEKFGSEDITEFIRSYAYYFYDWLVNDLGCMNYPETGHEIFTAELIDIGFLAGEGFGTLTVRLKNPERSYVEYGNSPEVILELTLYDDNEALDMTFSLPGKQKSPFIDSGCLMVGFCPKTGLIRFNKMGHMIDIAGDIAKDANHEIYCCESFVELCRGEENALMICRDAPLFSVSENGTLRFAPDYRKGPPLIFSNLFNNAWGTNFPQWIGGDLSFSYRFYFGVRDESGFRLADDFMSPLTARYSSEPGGKAPAQEGLLGSAEHLRVLALKPANDGNGLILRIMDCAGESRTVDIRFNRRYHVCRCDIFETDSQTVAGNANTIRFRTAPYEIHTFRLS